MVGPSRQYHFASYRFGSPLTPFFGTFIPIGSDIVNPRQSWTKETEFSIRSLTIFGRVKYGQCRLSIIARVSW